MIELGLGQRTSTAPRATEPDEERAAASPDLPTLAETEKSDLHALAARLQTGLSSRFEVLEPVAIGGMATLFQLRHALHHGLFVAKVLHPALAERPEIVSSFQTEALHAAKLGGHPNAVPIFDFGEASGLHFLIMPFVEGEDLDRLLQANGPFSRDEALHCVAQIGSLLCYAESLGITHCDLAPGNVRFDVFGRYRVLDLGISFSTGGATAYKPLGGTPLYTSPEQIRGEVPDVRSDIYALGLILAELLTGAPLLGDASLDEVKRKHLRGDWQLPPAIEADLPVAGLLRRMLALNRADRLPSSFELSTALAALGFERPEFRQRPTPEHLAGAKSVTHRRRLSAS